ncbi:MAG: VOC family protein [Chitinophagaceae bacterium]|nr:VOC family protein [Chitinophagaceae bacterium]
MKTILHSFLVVTDGAAAIRFYSDAYNAQVLERYDQENGRTMAKLSIDGNEFWLGSEEPEFGNYSPATLKGSPVRMILIVNDPDTIFANAINAGGTQLCPVTTEESWKIGKLADPFGHIGEIGHPLSD